MKPIPNFENYSITLSGRVINNITGKCKKPSDNHSGKGYLYVDLYCNGRRKRFYIHRLVAEAYIPNPDNKPYINHIDGNPKNNNCENLEWCTALENVEHASKVIKTMTQYKNANIAREKEIIGYKKGVVIGVFKSIREAERSTGIPSSNIVANLKGRQAHTKNIIWRYSEQENIT